MAAASGPDDAPRPGWAGEPLRSTFRFLAAPAAVGIATLGFGIHVPTLLLYAMVAVLGVVLLGRVFQDPEWLLATFILYIPLNKLAVGQVVPGLNGTSALLLLSVIVWVSHASRERRPMFTRMPGSRLVGIFAALSAVSVVTAGFTYGYGTLLDEHLGDLAGWITQFLVFFAFLNLIRDGAMARRVVVYMMIGAVVVLALGVQEWLEKRWGSSIEKSRLFGPQMQPNDFGAFLVYISGPFLGLLLTQLRSARGWVMLPFFPVLARVLLATFSRGAFIGMAVAGVAAGWVRGRVFLVVMAVLGAALVVAMPQLVPESLTARMSATTVDSGVGGEDDLDASSQTRLVLWEAAWDMIRESPVLGKGFKAFPHLKDRYTHSYVKEADNHNMFLYVGSQMGVPALLLFVWLLWRTWALGVGVYRAGGDVFRRAVGMGGAAMAAGVAVVNVFGSRMTDMAVDAYVWIYLAVLAHLWVEVDAERRAAAAAAPDVEAPA